MSKMSELSQVLEEMIACGEGMIKAAKAIKEIFSSTEEAPAAPEVAFNYPVLHPGSVQADSSRWK